MIKIIAQKCSKVLENCSKYMLLGSLGSNCVNKLIARKCLARILFSLLEEPYLRLERLFGLYIQILSFR